MGKTLVFGASTRSDRYSNLAIRRLRSHGEEVVAFGQSQGKVADVTIDNRLVSYSGIDTVTIYMNRYTQKPFYDYLVSLKPKRVIFNPGSENPELYEILESNVINYEQACTLILLSTNQY